MYVEWTRGKVDNPYLVTFLSQAPTFEWYVVKCGSKNKFQKEMCSKRIGLRAQNMITNLDSLTYIVKDPIRPPHEHENLRFEDGSNICMTSNKYEQSGYDLDLDFVTIV